MKKTLISDSATLSSYVEIGSQYPFEKIEPSMRLAEAILRRDILGTAQYTALQNAVDAAPSDQALSASDLALLEQVRLPLANYAMAIAYPRLQTNVSGAGVHIQSDEKKKTAFGWQIKQAVVAYNRAGDQGADELLDWLEANKATYTAWANSPQYTVFKDNLVNTTALFQSVRNIGNSRRVFLGMKPSMMFAQEIIKGVIGDDYFDVLLAEVVSGTFTNDNADPLKFARNAIINLSASMALAEMSISLDEEGALVKTSSNSEEPQVKNTLTAEKHSVVAEQWKLQGNDWLSKLQTFLNSEATSSLYAAYFNSDKYSDPSTTSSRFSNASDAKIGLF